MARFTFIAALVIVTCAGELARADRPIAVTAGIGAAWGRFASTGLEGDDTPDPMLRLDVGYRVEKHLALGVHFGISYGSGAEDVYVGRDSYDHDMTYTPLELGIGAQLGFEKVSVAPWIGMIDIGQHDNDNNGYGRELAVGFAVSYDLVVRPDSHRFGVFGGVLQTTEYSDEAGVRMISIGAAYHYW